MYGGGGETEGALEFLGLPKALAKSFEPEPCLVWPQNWKIVRLFIALATQWRVGMNGATGLDYAAVPPVARGYGIRLTQSVWDGLRAMEGEALRVMNAKAR